MIKYSTLVFLCIPLLCMADEPKEDGYHYKPAVGWYWYNQPKKKEEKKQETNPESPSPPASYSDVMKELHAKREELLSKAILTGNVEDVIRYKQFQDFLVSKVSRFSSRWESALLSHPELDYNLQHPVYNGAAPIEYAAQRKNRLKQSTTLIKSMVFFSSTGVMNPWITNSGVLLKSFLSSMEYPLLQLQLMVV